MQIRQSRCYVFCQFSETFKSFKRTILSIFTIYLNINQLDALNFIMSLFHTSTCFEYHVLIVMRSKLYYTASGIMTLKQVSGFFFSKITKITKSNKIQFYKYEHIVVKFMFILIELYFSNFSYFNNFRKKTLTYFSVMIPEAV